MKSLASCIGEFMDTLSIDNRKIAQAAFNNQQFKNAVLNIWKDRDAAKLILDHTNAFYIRKDHSKKVKRSACERNGSAMASDGEVVCEVYFDDSLILSEVNAHRELLALALRTNGLTFEEMRLVHSKGAMRSRHPFADEPNDNG